MAIFNSESRLVGTKKEAVAGTPETLTDADYNIRVRDVELGTLEVEYSDSSKYLDGTHTHSTVTPGLARAGITQTVNFAQGEFIASGTAGSPTWTSKIPYEKLLYSAGLKTIKNNPTDESTNDGYWEFVPEKSADCQTITETLLDISTCDNGSASAIEYKIAGAMSTLKIESSKAGAPFMLNFETKGKVAGVTDLTTIPVFNDANALATPSSRMLNTDIKITLMNNDGSDAGNTSIEFCSNVFSLDTGVTIAEILCQADAYGIKQSIITNREPMIEFSPLLEKLSDWDFWGGITSEQVYKFELINYEDSAKTKKLLEIVAHRVQLIQAQGADDGGFRRLGQKFRCLKNLQGITNTDKEHDFSIKIYGKTVDNTTP